MIEEHNTKVGSALPQNACLLRVNAVGLQCLCCFGREEMRTLENGGRSMSIQLGWAGVVHPMCADSKSCVLCLKLVLKNRAFVEIIVVKPVSLGWHGLV